MKEHVANANSSIDGTESELIDAFGAVSVVSVADALDTYFDLPRSVHVLHELDTSRARFVGRARTVRVVPTHRRDDKHVLTSSDVLDACRPGEVLVIDTSGLEQAVWGDQQAAEASRIGIAGVVVDGYLRDVKALRQQELPMFSRGRNVAPVRGHGRREEMDGPIDCCGLRVEPGDLVTADEDGVVVVPWSMAEDVLRVATEIERSEIEVRERLEEGYGLLEARDGHLPEYLRGWYEHDGPSSADAEDGES